MSQFHQRNINVTLECFVKKDGKYLMLHRNPNKKIMPGIWMARGGKREFNEGLFECAHREIMEETGLKIKNLRVMAVGNAHLKDLDEEFFFTFVEADYDSGEVHQDPEDGELVWLAPDEIIQQDNMLAEIHEIAPLIFGKNKEVISYKAVYDKGNVMSSFEIEK